MLSLRIVISVLFLVLAPAAPADDRESQLRQQLADLQSDVARLVQTARNGLAAAQSLSNSEMLAVQTLQEGLAEVRRQINNSISKTVLPIPSSPQNCTPIQPGDYAIYNDNLNRLQLNQQVLASQLQSVAHCPQIEEMEAVLALLQTQTALAQKEMGQLCPNNGSVVGNTTVTPVPGSNSTSNTSNTPTNSTNNNSTGGNTQSNGTSNNSNSQPTGTTNGTNGINGTSGTNGTNGVIGPNGTNGTTGNVKPAVYFSDLQNPLKNWIYGQVDPQIYYQKVNQLIANSSATLCPKVTPYASANGCIACGQIFDLALASCAACPPGTTFNSSIHQCDSSSGETYLKNSAPSAQNFIGSVQPIANLSTCPEAAPFFVGNQCVACNLPNYFDMVSRVCLTCGGGMQFDLSQKICRPPNNSVLPQFQKYNSNVGIAPNYAGSVPPADGALQSCPGATPFYNGMYCISCSSPLYFNFSSRVCSSCDMGYMFDTVSRNCLLDASQVYFESSLNGIPNYIGSPPLIASAQGKVVTNCPAERPFSSGQQCVSCGLPNFFNFQTNQCELCNPDLQFDLTSKSCQPRNSNAPQKNSNIAAVNNFMFNLPAYDPALPSCDANAPFFNGLACTACALPSFFNFRTLACQTCPPQQHFNPTNRQCEYSTQQFVSDTSNPNIYYNGNLTALQQANSAKLSSGLTLCPASAPFYDATRNFCISCGSSQPLFNIKYNKCMSCGEDSYFDANTRICIYKQAVRPTLERTLMNTFSF